MPSALIIGFLALFGLAWIGQTLVQEKNPARHLLVLGLMVAVVVGGFFGWQHYATAKLQRGESAKRAEFESRISRFAESHKAVRDWQKPLLGDRKAYSAELAPILVRQDGRPIFLFASIHDISAKAGRYVITVTDEVNNLDLGLTINLDCTPDQAHLVMSYPTEDTFALVAQIRAVESNEQVLQSSEAFYPVRLASGSCVDLIHITSEEFVEFVAPGSLSNTR